MGLSPAKPAELEPSMEMEVKSPCNGVCRLNIFNICKGCKRTREEISRWYVMSSAEKQQIVDRVKK
jgi:predicted Fe-S protein YdhL (DUF1289 family)